ncbi:uncharacterized protein LOC129585115 isoform X2 [Paramacrobiotus metropolitanus]|uniref:uncharacterized protein LOC129585115 isoform X2 n=1 Tax=Paramacrobiotus metropolitanus TaxID=2943436 RepID=UPI0024458046|nr:uncharacterized protein LOC129585115 isoform X2 [Paramacrobiotus metropolitanus]
MDSHEFRIPDMGNAVEMLDVLHKLSGILVETGYKDDTVDEFWLKSVKRLLDHADTRSTVLDIFNRFPFITLRKTLLNTHNQLFIETGVARCWLHTEPIPKDGNHTWMLSENSMDCKLIPGGFVLLPHCVKVEVVVNVQRNVLPNSRKETVIQMHADFSRNESADSDHGMTLPGIVYLWLPDASSFLDSIIANITFTDFGEMLPLQWKHVLKTPTRGSAAHNISCLQRSDLGSVWSSDLCNTSVFLRENMDLISHVQCLCSLSKTSHFFTLKLTNYSS